MNSKLEESKREIDNKENDIIILKKKMSDSELINKQLTQELKRNAIYITELENQIKFIENKVRGKSVYFIDKLNFCLSSLYLCMLLTFQCLFNI